MILQGETTTDADGVFKIKFLAENDKDADAKYQPVYTYKIEADLTDLNGETRSASTTMRVGTNAIQIASQLPYQFTTESNTLKVGVKNLNGQFINGKLIVELRQQPQASHVIIPSGLPQSEFQEIDNITYRKTFPYAELRKDEIETDWKKAPIIFRKELTTDSLTTVELPITENWDNGAYYVYIRAVELGQSFDNEDDVIDSRVSQSIWANLDQALQPELISSISEYTEKAAIFNVYTSMEGGVYATLTSWTNKELIDEKLVFLKKGKTEFTFPWSQVDGKEVSMRLQVQKENGFEESGATIQKPQKPVSQFQITTQSFRDKLQPGSEETWSFSIKNDNKVPMQAEVLASMYDKSLDEFATANWSAPSMPNYEFTYSPSFYSKTTSDKLQSLKIRFPIGRFYNNLSYDALNFYGLSLDNFYNSYNNYKNIIRRKFQKPKAKKGFIAGQVFDSSGEPILGATVIVKGSNNVVVSDFNGVYYIKAIANDVLVFTFAGYSPQTKIVKNDQIIKQLCKKI